MNIINNTLIDSKNINLKKNLYYSDNYTFVPLSYNKKDILLQTPKLYSKYGINNNSKYDTNYIDLSLKNIINDKSIEKFKNNLEIIYNKINTKYSNNYNIINYLKNINNEIIFRLKIQDNLLIFDQNKNKLEHMITNTYGLFIIHLQGCWIIDNDIYFQWYLLQAKIDIPIFLNEYSFIDEQKKMPPPPPPLPPQNFKKKIKTNIINNNNNNNNNVLIKKVDKNKDIKVPSLNDIKNALNNLKSIN